MLFDTRSLFRVESFDIGALEEKLLLLDLLNVTSLNTAVWYELRPNWEAVCGNMVLEGDILGLVV